MDRSRLIKINQHQAREREKKGEGTVKDPTLIDREMDQKFLFELIALIAQTYTPQNTHTHTHFFRYSLCSVFFFSCFFLAASINNGFND